MVGKRYKKSTLMGFTKDFLADLVLTAYHNEEVAIATLNQQAENVKDWRPVVHAHWTKIGADSRGRGGIFQCSAKGCTYPYKTDYCPKCGAKMDGECKQEV